MSQENVETVKRVLDAFNRGDLDAMLVEQDPEFEWRPAFGGAMLGAASYRGQSGFREYWSDAQGAWSQTFRFDPETFRHRGDAVVVVGRGEGRAGGVDVAQSFAMLFRLHEGKIVFGETYTDPTEALRVAGLEE